MNFDSRVFNSRQAYAAFQQLASRTDDALYQALGIIHALWVEMRDDKTLRSDFAAVLTEHSGDRIVNETLFLVKYAFFPHTLQPGPGHKAEITKASRYAKLINKALEQGLEPTDFVQFARTEGIQRTAVAAARPAAEVALGQGAAGPWGAVRYCAAPRCS